MTTTLTVTAQVLLTPENFDTTVKAYQMFICLI
jgi:hypothetical protein